MNDCGDMLIYLIFLKIFTQVFPFKNRIFIYICLLKISI